MTVSSSVSSPIAKQSSVRASAAQIKHVGRALQFRAPAKRSAAKKQRKSRVMFHYTKDELAPYFHVSQKEAARRLGVAVITLKRICKRGNFNWPYRANKTKLAQQQVQAQEQHRQEAPRQAAAPTRESDKPIHNGRQRVEEQMRVAMRSLAMCAQQIETPAMSSAAVAFSRLPFLCQLENES
ncbi:hypothetical protein ATCC90586_007444 [Pythium insidiosum]|nr:hypothetical protein ATCC90586_007444 [Pythium insidiosum]